MRGQVCTHGLSTVSPANNGCGQVRAQQFYDLEIGSKSHFVTSEGVLSDGHAVVNLWLDALAGNITWDVESLTC